MYFCGVFMIAEKIPGTFWYTAPFLSVEAMPTAYQNE